MPDPVNVLPGNMNAVMRPADERVGDIITRIWASFAQSGNPSAALQSYQLQPWRPISPGNINYYNLTSVSAPMGSDFRKGVNITHTNDNSRYNSKCVFIIQVNNKTNSYTLRNLC